MKKCIKNTVFFLLCVLMLTPSVSATRLLVPGGQVIGLELASGTVTVAAFDDELGAYAREEGLQVGDQITAINGKAVRCAGDVRKALEQCGGTVKISLLRQGKPRQLRLSPQRTVEGARLGVYLRQGITGVGTVTFYDPDSGQFGALGHGVNTQKGELAPMEQGRAYAAAILSVKKGLAGQPGQLLGTLDGQAPVGILARNTQRGIFGKLDVPVQGQPLPVADDGEVRTGEAVIRSTVDGTLREYSVEILKIYPKGGTRNMLLQVTDPALLEATGGIVQGMSGSPIIQDGRLVGAVTHVCVNK